MGHSVMVSQTDAKVANAPFLNPQIHPLPPWDKQEAPIIAKVSATGNSVLLEGQMNDLTPTANMLLQGSLRHSTKVKYKSIVNKWKSYCSSKDIPFKATTTNYVNFLAAEFDRDLKYSTIKNYNSTVDLAVGRKLFRGIHNVRPPVPK